MVLKSRNFYATNIKCGNYREHLACERILIKGQQFLRCPSKIFPFLLLVVILFSGAAPFKNNFGYFACAPFLWREMGKVLLVPPFLPFTNSDQYSFQIRLCQMDISAFSGQNKVTKICPNIY